MDTKVVIDKLEEYFLQQDPKVIARTAACFLVDIYRVYSIDSLKATEVDSLLYRIEKNSESLRMFVKEGAKGNVILHRMNSDEA